MKQNTREQMIEGALSLLAQQGLQATSFSEVLKLTRTPRGSIYYHFPGGKDQLVIEALEMSGKRVAEIIKAFDGTRPERIVESYFDLGRSLLMTNDFTAGSTVVAVIIATQDIKLLETAARVYRTWQEILTEKFIHAGLSEDRAADFATAIIAASEGAIVGARATKDIARFDQVARHMILQATTPVIKDENILWTREKRQ